MGALPLSPLDLALATSLVLVAGAVSLGLGLRMEGQLGLASVRTVVQLLLVGFVLRWVFDLEHIVPVLGIVIVMIVAATRASVTRPTRTFVGAHGAAFVTLTLTGLATTLTVTSLIVGIDPWFKPQYLIPLLGMVLGNGLTGISLTLDSLLESFDARRDLVEMDLAHGATRWEAARDPLRESVRRGMIPIINTMMVVGIVSLPGMMTGQILEGADPLAAVKYQIVVMFMLAAATSAGAMSIALLTFNRLFDNSHRLRAARIHRR